ELARGDHHRCDGQGTRIFKFEVVSAFTLERHVDPEPRGETPRPDAGRENGALASDEALIGLEAGELVSLEPEVPDLGAPDGAAECLKMRGKILDVAAWIADVAVVPEARGEGICRTEQRVVAAERLTLELVPTKSGLAPQSPAEGVGGKS